MNSYSTHATIIANHITAKDKEAFRQVFDSFAVGRDGTLTCEQAKAAVLSIASYTPTQLLSRLESDYGRTVEWPQFEQFLTRLFLEVQPIDEIRRVFELIDVDKTGAITAPQLKEAIESLGDHIDISEAEAMINEAAHTHTDQITLSELMTFLTEDDD